MRNPFEATLEDAPDFWILPQGEIPHADTIRFLRIIGGSGEVTNKELLALAYYLNGSRDARHSWPGEKLTHILAEMFGEHTPSNAERDDIHSDIEAIERECSRVAGPPSHEEDAISLKAIRIEDFPLPQIDRKIRIGCSDSGATFEVDLHHQRCNCPTWPTHRLNLKLCDVRRACRHMVEAYHQLIKSDEIPSVQPIFKEIIADRARRGRSIDVHSRWLVLKIRMRPHVICYGLRGWSYAYTLDGDGFNRFAFHNEEKRWSFAQLPKSAKTIEAYLNTGCHGTL